MMRDPLVGLLGRAWGLRDSVSAYAVPRRETLYQVGQPAGRVPCTAPSVTPGGAPRAWSS